MVVTSQTIAARPWAKARWMVLAPHPDDETLGAGALISEVGRGGRLVGLVYLTDGAGSHAAADATLKMNLVEARRSEARLALKRLVGPNSGRPVFLNWPDGQPYTAEDDDFGAATRRLAHFCDARKVDAVAVTAGHEPHCDHAAACGLAYAAAASAHRPVVVFEYLVWAASPAPGRRALRTKPMLSGARTAALAAHRSQLTPLHGAGFRLDPAKRRMSSIDQLYVKPGRHAR